MNFTQHSHYAGDQAIPQAIQEEIEAAIKAIIVKPAPKAAPKIRDAFLAHLKSSGWSSEVAVSLDSDMTITSMKEYVGLCMQTGNMARMYADLMKLQTLYLDNAIKSAAIIVPSQPMAALLGDNIAQSTRLGRELNIFRKAYIVPTLIFSLE
jgi:hypothetical protein